MEDKRPSCFGKYPVSEDCRPQNGTLCVHSTACAALYKIKPLQDFLVEEEKYLTATGWKKVAGVGRLQNWSHPEVTNGATHTQPAAVRRQKRLSG